MNSLTKKALAILCVLSVVFITMAHPELAKADYTNNDPTLIDTVENKYNGKLYVKFYIPANTTITYMVYPNIRNNDTQQGMKLQLITDTITNNKDSVLAVTKIITVKYYGKYVVRATYGDGIWDEHHVDSKLPYSKKTSKYTFTDDDMHAYENGEDVKILDTEKIALSLCKEAKEKNSTSEVFLTVTYTGLNGDITLAEDKIIEHVPKADYVYQVMYTPRFDGVNVYLLVYNASGDLIRCIKITEADYSNSGYRLRVL
ncbi:MAG: hypothetical protein IK050_00260 [Lachnospiraceae bacterium]|nr:hypothetical protein [Lachnospiraceae bacterium]